MAATILEAPIEGKVLIDHGFGTGAGIGRSGLLQDIEQTTALLTKNSVISRTVWKSTAEVALPDAQGEEA